MVSRLLYAHHVGRREVDPERDRARAKLIIARLAKAYPDWGPTLDFKTPLQLLIATLLAAQAQDERVNQVTKRLFAKYRTPADWLRVPDRVLEREIKPTGFFRQKTKAIKGACRGLVDRFSGKVPSTMEDLVSLHGVGRKTASIVLGNAFAVPSIAVDRHVARVADRLELTHRGKLPLPKDGPDAIELGLRERLPRAQWVKATWCLVLHGRRICRPVPECPRCPVLDLCPYPFKTIAPAAGAARRPAPRSSPRPAARRPRGG